MNKILLDWEGLAGEERRAHSWLLYSAARKKGREETASLTDIGIISCPLWHIAAGRKSALARCGKSYTPNLCSAARLGRECRVM